MKRDRQGVVLPEPYTGSEPTNWYRGVHEGGHAVAVWALGGTVTSIVVRRTFAEGIAPKAVAIVAKAGATAERALGNPDVRGCQAALSGSGGAASVRCGQCMIS